MVEQSSTVLIVDDNLLGREALADLLEPEGYNLVFAEDGLAALHMARHSAPDVVLLDVMMPGMDGYEVCRRLRADEVLADLPVVLVTAHDDRAARLRGLEAGADDFIAKPFDRLEMRARVRTITRLNRHRRLRAELERRQQAEAEREQLQAQLHQAQKLDSIGRLAGGVAHDFNNILSVILGCADLLAAELAAEQRALTDLLEIRAAAERAAKLTRQLLTFASRQALSPQVLDLNQSVEGMLQMLRRLIGEGIDLSWQPHPTALEVNFDPSHIDQILANVCINARDAMGASGHLRIATELATPSAEDLASHPGCEAGEYVVLAASDDGCGMPPEVLDRLFEPFFTTKEPGQGTGLGLATVYGIVRQQGGFIEVDSAVGQGTTLRIYLPRHPGERESPEGAAPPTSSRGSETLLVVEDDAASLRMLRTYLERRGYAVLAASTPTQALRLAEATAGSLDLLLTDVVMPDMHGGELAAAVRAVQPALKVLFMSGYPDEMVGQECGEPFQFIAKPYSLDQLAVRLRAMLEGD